jgi:hypothetical protein
MRCDDSGAMLRHTEGGRHVAGIHERHASGHGRSGTIE